jgi:hypothetical protein
MVSESKEVEASLGIRLLADLQTVFEAQTELASKAILGRLLELPEAPWSDLHGKSLDERGLAKRLRAYGVKPKTIRTANGTPRGYSRADLEEQWLRYLPASPDKSKTSKTSETIPGNAVSDVADVLLFPGDRETGQRCEHCSQPGDVLKCNYGLAAVWLHRECLDPWRVAYDQRTGDGLDIPGFLDRRNVHKG